MSLSKSGVTEKAKKLVLKGKIKEAVQEWEKLAAQIPDDGNIQNAIGDLYLKSKDKEKATQAFIVAGDLFQEAGFELKSIALYKKALKIDPSKIAIHEKLGAVYAERGLIGNAIDDYLKAAKFYKKENDFPAAIVVYRKLSDLDPQNVNTSIKIAELCQEQALFDDSIAEYLKVLAIYDKKNMTVEADAIRDKIHALDPSFLDQAESDVLGEKETPEVTEAESIETHAPLESIPQEPASEPEAIPELVVDMPLKTTSLLPEEPSEDAGGFLEPETVPMAIEATAFQMESTLETTALETQNAGELPPEGAQEGDIETALTEVEALVQYGMLEKAMNQLKGLVRSFPSEVKPLKKLKEIYLEQGEIESAAEICMDLAECYQEMGAEAAKDAILDELKKLTTRSPVVTKKEHDDLATSIPNEDSFSDSFSETTVNLENIFSSEDDIDLDGILSDRLGEDEIDLESSLDQSFKSLKASPNGSNAKEVDTQFDLGICYMEMGMLSEAMDAFALASQGESRFEDAMIMLALCHREEGDTSKAVEILENALHQPENTTKDMIAMKYELALLYEEMGDKKAAALYQEINRIDSTFRDVSNKCQELSSKYQ